MHGCSEDGHDGGHLGRANSFPRPAQPHIRSRLLAVVVLAQGLQVGPVEPLWIILVLEGGDVIHLARRLVLSLLAAPAAQWVAIEEQPSQS